MNGHILTLGIREAYILYLNGLGTGLGVVMHIGYGPGYGGGAHRIGAGGIGLSSEQEDLEKVRH